MPSVADFPQRLRRYVAAHPNILESFAAFAIKLVGAGLSFGFSFLIARQLGAAGSGIFALAQTTAILASTFALLGLDYVLLRTMAGDIREGKPAAARGAARSAVIPTGMAAVVIGGVLAALGAPLLHAALGAGLDKRLIYLAAVAVLPLTLNRLAVASLRGSGGVLAAQWLDGPLAMGTTIAILLGLVVAGVAVDAVGVIALYFATAAASAIAAWTFYARRARLWPPATPTPIVPMLRQSWRISLIVLSRLLLDWIVLLSLGIWLSTFEVGQFRTAWQISSLVMLLVSTIDTVTGPRIAAASRMGDTAGIRQIMRQSVVIMSMISLPIFVVALGFPEWVLGLFGPEFVAAAPALRILALGQVINVLSGPLGGMLVMTGEEGSLLTLSIASLFVLALLCVTLIPAYGLVGAAATTSLMIAFRTGISWFLVQRSFRRKQPPAAGA